MMPRILVSMTLATLMPWAWAETPSTLTSTGHATVKAVAHTVQFTFEKRSEGETLLAAAETLATFENDLRQHLKDHELIPRSLTISGIALPDVTRNEASVQARATFGVVRFASDEERIRSMTGLFQSLRDIAAGLGCSVAGPVLMAESPEEVEQRAIARATENALYKADAVAQLMESQIYAVQGVVINRVDWNSDPNEGPATLSTVHCSATVTVEYLYAPLP